MTIVDPNVASARLDEAALLEILEHRVHGLSRESNQIAEVGLVQPQRNEHALVVGHTVIVSEIQSILSVIVDVALDHDDVRTA